MQLIAMAFLYWISHHWRSQVLSLSIVTIYYSKASLTSYIVTHLSLFYTCFTDSSHNSLQLELQLDFVQTEVTNIFQVIVFSFSLFGAHERFTDFCMDNCFWCCYSSGISVHDYGWAVAHQFFLDSSSYPF